MSQAVYEDHDGQHGCGILDDSSILCWGDGTWGETNAPPGPFVDVAVCEYGSYALAPDGALAAWGGMVAPTDGPFTAMAVGPTHEFFLRPDGTLSACALGADGVVQCWGDTTLTDGAPGTDRLFSEIACGYGHACGVQTDGEIYCWGYDRYGETVPPN